MCTWNNPALLFSLSAATVATVVHERKRLRIWEFYFKKLILHRKSSSWARIPHELTNYSMRNKFENLFFGQIEQHWSDSGKVVIFGQIAANPYLALVTQTNMQIKHKSLSDVSKFWFEEQIDIWNYSYAIFDYEPRYL